MYPPDLCMSSSALVAREQHSIPAAALASKTTNKHRNAKSQEVRTTPPLCVLSGVWASARAARELPGSPTEHRKASPSSSSRLPLLWLPVITGVKAPELLIFPEAFSKQQQPQQFSCKANKIPILLIQQDFQIVISWLCPLGKPQMIFHNVCVYVCETERKRLTDSTAHQCCLVFFFFFFKPLWVF